jgi:hypothetical protein
MKNFREASDGENITVAGKPYRLYKSKEQPKHCFDCNRILQIQRRGMYQLIGWCDLCGIVAEGPHDKYNPDMWLVYSRYKVTFT